MRYSLVPLVNALRPEVYRDILAMAVVLAKETAKDENLLEDSAKINAVERQWARWEGKLFPGGQSTAWAMRFSLKAVTEPLVIKCFFGHKPYLLVHHVASADRFQQDFPGPILVKGKEYLIKPARNFALARIEGEDLFLFHVQQFSQGVVIPPSVPIGEICKVIAAKGYVADPFAKNWRIKTEKGVNAPIIEYIDELYWHNIYQQQDRLQTLAAQLDKFQYSL